MCVADNIIYVGKTLSGYFSGTSAAEHQAVRGHSIRWHIVRIGCFDIGQLLRPCVVIIKGRTIGISETTLLINIDFPTLYTIFK